ncbi:MAG: glycosyltransferase family 2 protein [Patescibacteria group bacterium]|nr:glycosyltransferase family 2 protein [Patescibacteria group bacterium]
MRKIALIILPTHNEAGNIKKLIKRIFIQENKIEKFSLEILVNDSSSVDNTAGIVKELIKKYPKKLHLIETKKEGLGKAYYQGFLYAQVKIKPFVIFEMDADLSHQPEKIPEMLKEIEKGADMVIGSRYVKGGSIPKNWGFHRKIFSFFGNLIIRFGFMKLEIHDWTSGFRAMKIWILNQSLEHIKKYSGYVFQVALLDFALKQGARVKEIPINFVDREYGESKIFFSQYIFSTLAYLVMFSPFIRFSIVGTIGFLIDFLILTFFDKGLQIPSSYFWLAQLVSAETAIASNFLLNNFWSFGYKKIKKNLFGSFLKFNLISVGSIVIQSVLLQLAVSLFGRQYWIIAKILIIALIIIPYSYLLYNKVVWNK